MKLLAAGVDHHSSSPAIREAIAFGESKSVDALESLRRSYPDAEFVILSTCNRVEIYAAADEGAMLPTFENISSFIAKFHDVPVTNLAEHLVEYRDEHVIHHLFRVSASLESVVLGEGQILGQVKEAYQIADRNRSIGAILHTLFREAIRVGKKVREATGIDQGKLSVASVAVDLARDVFDTFHDKTVLVIGAGKMGDLTLRHLSDLKPGRVVVTNRDFVKAEIAAAKWNGTAAAFDKLYALLIEADVVVSTTASTLPIVTFDHYQRVQRARRNRLTLILDIAVPRDFEERIGDLDQVLLYHVDDLRERTLANLGRRKKAIDSGEKIIESETAACAALLRHQRTAGTVLRRLGDYADDIRLREVDRLIASCPDLSERQREAIDRFALRLQNQFLHHPRSALRSAAETHSPEHAHSLLTALKHLFGLD